MVMARDHAVRFAGALMEAGLVLSVPVMVFSFTVVMGWVRSDHWAAGLDYPSPLLLGSNLSILYVVVGSFMFFAFGSPRQRSLAALGLLIVLAQVVLVGSTAGG
jgi:hypothetical protein